MKKHLLETVTLIAAAVLCALVSNTLAGRERKLKVVGNYPNALKVPSHEVEQPLVPLVTTQAPETSTIVPVPVVTTTTTTAPAATTTTATTTTAPRVIAAPIPPAAPPQEDILKRFPAHPDKPWIEVHGDDVAALHARGALFIDARRTSVYEQGHIAGARSMSVWEADVDQKANALYEERNDPREQLQPIVVYCSGGDCEDSHMLAQKLWGLTFNNVYVYKDGFPDWQQRGLPVHTGTNP
jgi:rhodanese-related sulfurtransferase